MQDGTYQNLYPVNNSGNGKLREIPEKCYFSVIQPNDVAVGEGNGAYTHTVLFIDSDRYRLTQDLTTFMRRNSGKIDHNESRRMMEQPVDSYSIEDRLGEIVIGIANETFYTGPEKPSEDKGYTKWAIYGNEKFPENVLYGNEKKPSRVWWK